MKSKSILFLTIASILTFTGCKKTVSDPMLLSNKIFKDLSSTLMKSVAEKAGQDGYPAAVAFCSENANKVVKQKFLKWKETVIQEHGYKDLKVARRTLKPRNQNNLATGEAAEVLRNWETEGTPSPTLRKEGNISRVYTPIKIVSPLCLNCHGSESEVSNETARMIEKKYPEDKAKGYTLGELRGLFLVELIR